MPHVDTRSSYAICKDPWTAEALADAALGAQASAPVTAVTRGGARMLLSEGGLPQALSLQASNSKLFGLPRLQARGAPRRWRMRRWRRWRARRWPP